MKINKLSKNGVPQTEYYLELISIPYWGSKSDHRRHHLERGQEEATLRSANCDYAGRKGFPNRSSDGNKVSGANGNPCCQVEKTNHSFLIGTSIPRDRAIISASIISSCSCVNLDVTMRSILFASADDIVFVDFCVPA